MKPGHKGEDTGNRQTSRTCAPTPKNPSPKHTLPMSANPNTPLFVLSDNNNNNKYEDDPAITQVKANLAVAECIQQEMAEQKRLEREEWKARVDAERLTREIKEAERQWRELEEAEIERLTQEIKEAERQQRELEEAEIERLTREKEKLEEEKRAEQWCTVTLRGSERAAERRQAALVASPPEAGLSWAPPQKPERTTKGADQGPGIVIPEKNCACYVTQEVLC